MNRSKVIDRLIQEKGLSRRQFAETIGIPATTLQSMIQRGVGKASIDNVIKVCKGLGITVDQLERMASDTYPDEVKEGKSLYQVDASTLVNLPHFGAVSCGEGLVNFETPTEQIPTPMSWINGGEYFYLTASGDSMTGAKIDEGDLLLIRSQNIVENGEIAVAVIDDEIFLKTFIKHDNTVILQSENNKYPPRIYNPNTDKNIRIIGKLKKVIKNV